MWIGLLFLSGLVGFISLSFEIFWANVVSFATANAAGTVVIVLGWVLVGIAGGAYWGYAVCRRKRIPSLVFIATVCQIAAVINYFGTPFIAYLTTVNDFLGLIHSAVIMSVSFLLGSIFPVICHAAISDRSTAVGWKISLFYCADILGAASGPLITGYILMNLLTIEQTNLYFSIALTLIAVIIILLDDRKRKRSKIAFGALGFIFIAVSHHTFQVLHADFLERLQFKSSLKAHHAFKFEIQNRHGVITVEPHPDGDIFYGHGAYDGRVNLDPVLNSNSIDRAYLIATLHPNPKDALEIGLGTGSWAKVIAALPGLKDLAIVEINPDYLEILRHYPEVAGLLMDDKVTIHIDDGRRWLIRNVNRRFDLIVMNTTFFWRERVTNLLSLEFLLLCKRHLKPGGIVYWNSTDLPDVAYTAAYAFKYVTTYKDFVAGSDRPYLMSTEEKSSALRSIFINGRQIFKEGDIPAIQVLNRLVGYPLTNLRGELMNQKLRLIRDGNMAPEYKARWDKLKMLMQF